MSDAPLTNEKVLCKRHKWSLSLAERMVEKRSNLTTKYFRLQRLHQCLKCGYRKWSDA